ncbi:MAG TPA: FAD-binding oxidoreductase [Steroidobacteraceae bacterium]
MGHVASYYAATANPASRRPALEGEVAADVCVVGGGIAGCAAALELAERGQRVVLLEAQRIGWGASGRSGGQAIAGFGTSQENLVELAGTATARAMWDLSIEALHWVRERVARHGIDCDLQWGHVHAAVKPRQRDELLRHQQELETRYDYRSLRFLERGELRALLATKRYVAGLYDSGSGHLHPLNYTLGLAAAAEAAGVQICEASRVETIEPGDPARLHTGAGCVRARHVVLTRGGYVKGLHSPRDWQIMPVGTYVGATEVLGEARIRALMRDNVAVADVNFVLDYFRCSADHRLLFGGRVSYSGINEQDSGRATRARMLQVFPQLAGTRLEYVWGGYIDITMNRAPDFGRIGDNVYYLQGFSGHGIALAGMAGRLVAEAIAGQSERFDVFGRIRHHVFPGGRTLRTPALVLAMLWFRLRDLL